MTREGHPAAQDFESLFLPHLDAAFNLARWILRNEHDAEDAVQEAYLRACRAFPRFRGENGKAWLMTIVRNVCYTAIGKRNVREADELFDEAIHHGAVEQLTEEPLRQEIDSDLLHVAMDKLPTEYREVIALHDLEELSYKEIAAIAGIPIGTVMSRLSRARQRLRAEVVALQKGGGL
jgi:RNA polymerase sigma-70 factor (ECF subfamily)